MPYTKLIKCKCFNLPNTFIKDTNYEDVYFSFYNDYQRQNPITKIDGLKNYINKLRINGYISQKVYNFSFMNIDTINVMELYYRSKMNRNIVQSQQAIANYNNSYRNSIQNKNKFRKKLEKENGSNTNKETLENRASLYDEQLTNLLKQSLYKQRFGSNLDNLNKILNNKNIFNSNNTEPLLNNNEQNNDEELKSEGIIEKNKDYILKQYKYPFLLNISHNIGTTGDLGILTDSQKVNGIKLNGINEIPELNDSEEDEIVRDKGYYGVDYDIYSKKSSSSQKNSQKSIINIEMKDLSENKKNNKNKNSYEMSSYNEEKEEKYDYDYLEDNSIKNKKENKKENETYDKNKALRDYFLNLTKDNYDGDNDSDYDS